MPRTVLKPLKPILGNLVLIWNPPETVGPSDSVVLHQVDIGVALGQAVGEPSPQQTVDGRPSSLHRAATS